MNLQIEAERTSYPCSIHSCYIESAHLLFLYWGSFIKSKSHQEYYCFVSMQFKMASSSTISLNAIISMYQNLIKEWNKKPPNLDSIGKLLTSMKVEMRSVSFTRD